MRAPSIDPSAVRAALAERDPETLVGPVMCLLTWLAVDCTGGDGRACGQPPERLRACLAALSAHPAVALHLRLAAGGLAIEHRAPSRAAAASR